MTQHGSDVQQPPERPSIVRIESPDGTGDDEAERSGGRWRYGSALAAARALNVQGLAQARR